MKNFICKTQDTEKLLSIKYFQQFGDIYLYLHGISFNNGVRFVLERGRSVPVDKQQIIDEVKNMFAPDNFINFNEFQLWIEELWKTDFLHNLS